MMVCVPYYFDEIYKDLVSAIVDLTDLANDNHYPLRAA